MFGIKTLVKNSLKKGTKELLQKRKLSNKGMSQLQLLKRLAGVQLHLRDEKSAYRFDSPIAPLLNPVSSAVKNFLSRFNPNNLGNWQNTKPYNLPTQAEAAAVEIYKQLMHAPEIMSGYFTSGGTEGNLFCAWAGKAWLKNQAISIENIALIRNDLTHYSVEKAAKITEIRQVVSPISLENWAHDPQLLLKTITHLYTKGKRGFLLPLTLGYTVGGTDDPVNEIIQLLVDFKKKYPKVRFFVWIDAAYTGISKPFLEKNWRPFSLPFVQAVGADFHKILGVSYPAGILLHKKALSKLVETTPAYIDHKDQTVLGSRSGMTPIETLFTLQKYGFHQLKQKLQATLEQKNAVLLKLATIKNARIVTAKYGLQAAVLSPQPLNDAILTQLDLRPGRQIIHTNQGKKTLYFYKLYFFPRF